MDRACLVGVSECGLRREPNMRDERVGSGRGAAPMIPEELYCSVELVVKK